MSNLIDREALKAVIEYNQNYVNAKLSVDDVLKIIDNAPSVKTFIDKIDRVTTPDGRTSIVGRNLTKEEELLFHMLTNHDILTYSRLGGQVVPDLLQGWRYEEDK